MLKDELVPGLKFMGAEAREPEDKMKNKSKEKQKCQKK